MLKGKCHCGQLSWTHTGKDIETITACSCSVCHRYGALWAYGYLDDSVKISGATQKYEHGDKVLGFHFCGKCGCMAYWLGYHPNKDGKFRIAVNTRLMDNPKPIEMIPIRHFDGADEWKEQPRDQRCVKDMWY